MTDSEKYTPLSERLQQDVWHDNFVPKYSALATARPSRVVLSGVWLIFAPMAIMSLLYGLTAFVNAPDFATAVIFVIGSVFFFILSISILYTQTRRFFAAKSASERESSDDGDFC